MSRGFLDYACYYVNVKYIDKLINTFNFKPEEYLEEGVKIAARRGLEEVINYFYENGLDNKYDKLIF